ncbi:MAG: serine/threonine protein kinase [Deltaproteobacteria bacterium]|nr:serine/threonine protein kinase [Deltaproteobacteria bacterium]
MSSRDLDPTTSLVAELRALRNDDDEITRRLRLAALQTELLGDEREPIYFGRFKTLSLLGRGGMGVVLRAHDPKLDREVALKVLLASPHESDAVARMLREAQSMARLVHPNLVVVHEVVDEAEPPFIVMEYVVGETLRAWMDRPRRWQEVLATFGGAGRGLMAAHAEGIVHRDFKPSNVMVGSDGRARVADFGLARLDPTISDDANGDATETVAEVTRTGTIVGTPAYMAPEQHAGEAAGAAADQFAYCVALFEALYGARPFGGATSDALYLAKQRGVAEAPAGDHGVPGWMHAVVIRGLAPTVADRWPSMAELLAALERGQSRARGRRAAGAGLAVAGAVAAVAVLGVLDRRQRIHACERAGEEVGDIWNGDIEASTRAAMIASGASGAATTADLTMPWLAARADAWRTARTEVCLDASVHRSWSSDLVDRAQWCLDERKLELEALVTELSRGDPTVTREAVVAAATLPSADACSDPAVLEHSPPPPFDRREDVRPLLRTMAAAEAAIRTGRRADGIDRSVAALAQAEAVAWPPQTARARLLEARALEGNADYAAAEEAGRHAYFDAAAIGEWGVAADAATRLTYLVSYRRGRHADALEWSEHAKIALAHAADPAGLRAAALAAYIGTAAQATSDAARAQAMFERALTLYRSALGSSHPSVANALSSLANLRKRAGDYDEAQRLHERALAIREEVLGPEHPDVGSSLSGLASVAWARGDTARAMDLYERAVQVREAALGPEHPDVAAGLINVAGVATDRGEHRRAQELLSRALSIYEATLGSEHPNVATTLAGLAMSYAMNGQPERGRETLERALALLEATLGPEHPDVAMASNNLGLLYLDAGDATKARASFERALQIAEVKLGAEHPQVALALQNLQRIHAEAGDPATALALAERAVAIYERIDGEQPGSRRRCSVWRPCCDATVMTHDARASSPSELGTPGGRRGRATPRDRPTWPRSSVGSQARRSPEARRRSHCGWQPPRRARPSRLRSECAPSAGRSRGGSFSLGRTPCSGA